MNSSRKKFGFLPTHPSRSTHDPFPAAVLSAFADIPVGGLASGEMGMFIGSVEPRGHMAEHLMREALKQGKPVQFITIDLDHDLEL